MDRHLLNKEYMTDEYVFYGNDVFIMHIMLLKLSRILF